MNRTLPIVAAASLALSSLVAVCAVQPAERPATSGFRTSLQSGTPTGPALALVAAESPDKAFAFSPSQPGSSTRPVIVHYFPPFPLTIGRYGPQNDYYARHYLRAEGENGKFAAHGGYIRQRPLPGPRARRQVQADLRLELARAARIGVDAFGVDLLALEGKMADVVPALLDAAQETDPRFRIAIEPDMIGLRKATLDELIDYLLWFGKHPAAFRDSNGRLVVMPFRAEAREPRFWRTLIARMAEAGEPIAFIPNFVDPSRAGQFAEFSASVSRWGSRDANAGLVQRSFGARANERGYPAWMATAAPQDFRPKSRLMFEAQGSKSFTEAILAGIHGEASGLHIVTWNDYSEATEVQPSSATRFAYYDIAAYYIAWFKTGKPPAIVRDGFVGLHRKQLFRPREPSRGKAWKVQGLEHVDIVEMTAFLTSPAELTIMSGGQTFRQNASAGLTRFAAPAAIGPVRMSIARDGRTIAECKSPWTIAANPDRHDPIYAGFSSLRGCN